MQLLLILAMIAGVVRDANTGAPVEGAVVAIRSNSDEREVHERVVTGPDGRFAFPNAGEGRHRLRVFPRKHLEPEPQFFVGARDGLDVRLESGREVAIVVIDRENDPVANAHVLVVADAKVRARAVTDEDGRAAVAVPSGAAATLFVIPETGPFGMLRVGREEVKERLKVYLPRTESSLLIRALTTTGQNMPPFSLLMRYDGELVPPEVAEELSAVQGLQLTTGAESEALLRSIPSGSYEFWPYRTDDEAEAIVATADALLAPIQVNVRTGENKIAVKIARRRGGS